MKRITLFASLVMFFAGILMSSSDERIQFTVRAKQVPQTRRAQSKLTGKVEMEFIRFISNQFHTYAQYRITNGSAETVHFPGFARNSNCLIFIRQGALVKQMKSTWGQIGFGSQSLFPGDAAISDIQVPDEDGPFEIGFGYEVGPKHRWDIAWSEKIEPAAKQK